MNFDPYESPQTPPEPTRRHADAQALGKVLAVVFGIIVLALCASAALLFYALFALPWM